MSEKTAEQLAKEYNAKILSSGKMSKSEREKFIKDISGFGVRTFQKAMKEGGFVMNRSTGLYENREGEPAQVESGETIKTSLYVNPGTWKRVKIDAVMKGTTANQLVKELIEKAYKQ